ncbi:MAG TPA: CPBP family intramembrane metalloprotease [Bacteroidetes bacterium]|nr:CPBP family intramembrane metalloprotease [Bacteroidota bacterium]
MQAAYSISAVTLALMAYYFTIHSEPLHFYFTKKHGEEKAKVSWVFFQRMAGVFYFGIVPLLIAVSQNLGFEQIGLGIKNKAPFWGWVIGLSLLCVFINYFAAQKDDHLEIYPQVRRPVPWSRSLTFSSSLTLVLYTLAYETMFRGYLLFTCAGEMGAAPAIAVNTSIYALVHLPKGWKETVGAIPMGIVLCWLTLKTGNIWTAVAVHVALALSSEWFSLFFHGKKMNG